MGTEQCHDGDGVTERWDRVFEALTAEPRRQLVVSLMDVPAERRVSLPDAAMSPTAPPNRERLRHHLYHRHLPLLEDYGYVRWDRDRFRAQRGPRFEEIATVFDSLYGHASEIPDQLVVGCRELERARTNQG